MVIKITFVRVCVLPHTSDVPDPHLSNLSQPGTSGRTRLWSRPEPLPSTQTEGDQSLPPLSVTRFPGESTREGQDGTTTPLSRTPKTWYQEPVTDTEWDYVGVLRVTTRHTIPLSFTFPPSLDPGRVSEIGGPLPQPSR